MRPDAPPVDQIDYAQNYAREGLNSSQKHPPPANVDNKDPSVSSRLTEGSRFAGQVCKGRALPAELSAHV